MKIPEIQLKIPYQAIYPGSTGFRQESKMKLLIHAKFKYLQRAIVKILEMEVFKFRMGSKASFFYIPGMIVVTCRMVYGTL